MNTENTINAAYLNLNANSFKTLQTMGMISLLLSGGLFCAADEYKTARAGVKEADVASKSATLHTWEYPGEKPAIILLHGGPGVPDYTDGIARILNKQGHRVITYDQRGSGASAAKDGSLKVDDHVEDLEAIRKHFGLENAHLLGHSWGGMLAQAYASNYPARVASLFLSNSGIGLGKDWRDMESAVMNYNREKSGFLGFSALGCWSLVGMFPGSMGDAGVRNLFARVWKNYYVDPSKAPEADANWLAGIKGGPVHKTRNDAALRDAADLTLSLPGAPVLVLFGERDIYGDTTERLFKRFPEAKHIVLKNTGHLPWLEAPAEYAEILNDFYAGQN